MNELGNVIESIWVTTSRGTNASNIVVSVYFHLPSQEENVDNAFQKQIANLSKKHKVIVDADFNYPNICQVINSIKHGSSRKFLSYLADKFLLLRMEAQGGSYERQI